MNRLTTHFESESHSITMKKLFIVANWKSNKTLDEAMEWLNALSEISFPLDTKEMIVCPPFTLLPEMSRFVIQHNLPVKLGAQDVSPFGEGAYTGSVNAKQIKEFAEYVLIGHSERKRLFGEAEEIIPKKVEQALAVGLKPIVFLQDQASQIPSGVEFVVYEPPSAISGASGGVPEKTADVLAAADVILKTNPSLTVLYGGSVNAENVATFTTLPEIAGVVPGKASLDAASFLQIVENAH